MITRPQPAEYNSYYGRYVSLVPEGDVLVLMDSQHRITQAMLAPLSAEQARYRYAEGKWSVAEVVGHMADTERIFAHRALRFARADTTPLPGFEQNDYVPAARFDERSLGSVAAELAAVRAASLALFRGLPDDAYERSGSASGYPFSVRALAYLIVGHELHHRGVLQNRYRIPLPAP